MARDGTKRSHEATREPSDPDQLTEPASFGGALARFTYSQGQHSASEEQPGKMPAGNLQSRTPRQDRRVPQRIEQVSSSSPKRRRTAAGAQSSTYVAPSRYAHLPLLNDVLAPDLLILFIGLNPGITTSETGHAYAHPSNLFWKLLFSSGITPDRRCAPTEDVNMPELYGVGFTNIVGRPTKDQSELSRAEMVQGAPLLESKARQWRPEVCCLVGKGIWEAVYKSKHGSAQARNDFSYGWQSEAENMGRDGDWTGSRVFVAASTSGASASLKPHEKEAIWKPLGDWAQSRRTERAIVP